MGEMILITCRFSHFELDMNLRIATGFKIASPWEI
jgi:hypothetical protein